MIKQYQKNVYDLAGTPVGVKLPLTSDERFFFGVNYTTLDQIKTNLKNFLLTRKGSRIMLPTYGSILADLIFENTESQTIIENIISEIEKNFPYLNIITLNVTNNNEHTITVDLEFQIKTDTDVHDLSVLYVI